MSFASEFRALVLISVLSRTIQMAARSQFGAGIVVMSGGREGGGGGTFVYANFVITNKL